MGYFAVSKNLWSTSTKKVNLECLFRDFSSWGLAGPARLYPAPRPRPAAVLTGHWLWAAPEMAFSLAQAVPKEGWLLGAVCTHSQELEE